MAEGERHRSKGLCLFVYCLSEYFNQVYSLYLLSFPWIHPIDPYNRANRIIHNGFIWFFVEGEKYMPLKFRLRGLAETFVENISCPHCGHDGGEDNDRGFLTEHTRVTFSGIIVVIQCEGCKHVFVPEEQKLGVINASRLRTAVEKDSENTGAPALDDMKSVKLEVERMNAERGSKIH